MPRRLALCRYGVGYVGVEDQVEADTGLVARCVDQANGGQRTAGGDLNVLQGAGYGQGSSVSVRFNRVVSKNLASIDQHFVNRMAHRADAVYIRNPDTVVLTSALDDCRVPHLQTCPPAFLAIVRATPGFTARWRGTAMMPSIRRCRKYRGSHRGAADTSRPAQAVGQFVAPASPPCRYADTPARHCQVSTGARWEVQQECEGSLSSNAMYEQAGTGRSNLCQTQTLRCSEPSASALAASTTIRTA